MGEVTMNMIRPWQKSNSLMLMDTGPHFFVRRRLIGKKLLSPKQRCLLLMRNSSMSKGAAPKPLVVKMMINPSTYSASITTDIPLYESPAAAVSFDNYLENKTRVFRAIFPDERRSKRLNEEEWRIKMLPIQLLFLDARLVIDMRLRCKSQGKDYPAGVPCGITKLLELKMIRWDLQGLDEIQKPSHFSLGVDGVMYPERHGNRSRLKGRVVITMSCVLPPVLDLIPEHIRREAAETVLKRLVENMKDKVNGSLLADYSKFQMENNL